MSDLVERLEREAQECAAVHDVSMCELLREAAAALRELEAQEPGDWRVPGRHINSIQQQSIANLVKRCKQAHFVDVRVRINGEYEFYEADWIKHMRAAIDAARGSEQ